MIRFVWWSSLALFAPLLAFSCAFNADYKDSRFQCQVAGDCPETYLCLSGFCRPPGSEPTGGGCDGGTCQDSKPDIPPKPCKTKGDCAANQSCAPKPDTVERHCVPACNALTQQDCPTGQSCVAAGGQAYCVQQNGKKREGGLCSTDIDCEVYLYCRPVKGKAFIKRCAPPCLLDQGCTGTQSCLPLRPTDKPYGYCEPQPTVVQPGAICGGDLVCPQNYSCTRKQGEQYSRCSLISP